MISVVKNRILKNRWFGDFTEEDLLELGVNLKICPECNQKITRSQYHISKYGKNKGKLVYNTSQVFCNITNNTVELLHTKCKKNKRM